jgi:hypothetical protein
MPYILHNLFLPTKPLEMVILSDFILKYQTYQTKETYFLFP